MTRPDSEFVEIFVGTWRGMLIAAHQGDQARFIGELSLFLDTVIDLAQTLDQKPADEALRRAVVRLGAEPRQP